MKDLIVVDGVEYIRKDSIPTKEQVDIEFMKLVLHLIEVSVVQGRFESDLISGVRVINEIKSSGL